MNESISSSKKFTRMSQQDMPRVTFKESLALAQALLDDFAGKDATPIDLAQSLSRSPSSSSWRFLTGAAVAYGITTAGYNASSISLTPLGKRIVQPLDEGSDRIAIIEAVMTPGIPKAFYDKYNGNKLPSDQIAKNVLVQLGVPLERTDEAIKIIIQNAKEARIITETSGNQYIQTKVSASRLSNSLNEEQELEEEDSNREELEPISSVETSAESITETKSKPIFIAHGKDTGPLGMLKTILDRFKIPYKVAIEEAHSGRPISEKVRDVMNECGSAIFIFSSSGEAEDPNRGVMANLNVVFELGAASVLYGEKVIIFKEDNLALSSDFSDLGHISFEKDKLDAKALDLLRELIAMGAVQVHV